MQYGMKTRLPDVAQVRGYAQCSNDYFLLYTNKCYMWGRVGWGGRRLIAAVSAREASAEAATACWRVDIDLAQIASLARCARTVE